MSTFVGISTPFVQAVLSTIHLAKNHLPDLGHAISVCRGFVSQEIG